MNHTETPAEIPRAEACTPEYTAEACTPEYTAEAGISLAESTPIEPTPPSTDAVSSIGESMLPAEHTARIPSAPTPPAYINPADSPELDPSLDQPGFYRLGLNCALPTFPVDSPEHAALAALPINVPIPLSLAASPATPTPLAYPVEFPGLSLGSRMPHGRVKVSVPLPTGEPFAALKLTHLKLNLFPWGSYHQTSTVAASPTPVRLPLVHSTLQQCALIGSRLPPTTDELDPHRPVCDVLLTPFDSLRTSTPAIHSRWVHYTPTSALNQPTPHTFYLPYFGPATPMLMFEAMTQMSALLPPAAAQPRTTPSDTRISRAAPVPRPQKGGGGGAATGVPTDVQKVNRRREGVDQMWRTVRAAARATRPDTVPMESRLPYLHKYDAPGSWTAGHTAFTPVIPFAHSASLPVYAQPAPLPLPSGAVNIIHPEYFLWAALCQPVRPGRPVRQSAAHTDQHRRPDAASDANSLLALWEKYPPEMVLDVFDGVLYARIEIPFTVARAALVGSSHAWMKPVYAGLPTLPGTPPSVHMQQPYMLGLE